MLVSFTAGPVDLCRRAACSKTMARSILLTGNITRTEGQLLALSIPTWFRGFGLVDAEAMISTGGKHGNLTLASRPYSRLILPNASEVLASSRHSSRERSLGNRPLPEAPTYQRFGVIWRASGKRSPENQAPTLSLRKPACEYEPIREIAKNRVNSSRQGRQVSYTHTRAVRFLRDAAASRAGDTPRTEKCQNENRQAGLLAWRRRSKPAGFGRASVQARPPDETRPLHSGPKRNGPISRAGEAEDPAALGAGEQPENRDSSQEGGVSSIGMVGSHRGARREALGSVNISAAVEREGEEKRRAGAERGNPSGRRTGRNPPQRERGKSALLSGKTTWSMNDFLLNYCISGDGFGFPWQEAIPGYTPWSAGRPATCGSASASQRRAGKHGRSSPLVLGLSPPAGRVDGAEAARATLPGDMARVARGLAPSRCQDDERENEGPPFLRRRADGAKMSQARAGRRRMPIRLHRMLIRLHTVSLPVESHVWRVISNWDLVYTFGELEDQAPSPGRFSHGPACISARQVLGFEREDADGGHGERLAAVVEIDGNPRVGRDGRVSARGEGKGERGESEQKDERGDKVALATYFRPRAPAHLACSGGEVSRVRGGFFRAEPNPDPGTLRDVRDILLRPWRSSQATSPGRHGQACTQPYAYAREDRGGRREATGHAGLPRGVSRGEGARKSPSALRIDAGFSATLPPSTGRGAGITALIPGRFLSSRRPPRPGNPRSPPAARGVHRGTWYAGIEAPHRPCWSRPDPETQGRPVPSYRPGTELLAWLFPPPSSLERAQPGSPETVSWDRRPPGVFIYRPGESLSTILRRMQRQCLDPLGLIDRSLACLLGGRAQTTPGSRPPRPSYARVTSAPASARSPST
ncbi:hypothetical protein JHW43_003058 [Diplocarpon mali]|nr:hypothetical protein JHW43_003058 [Diplocarpon mali]